MTSESSRGEFSPPSAVVEPACSELLLRLRRARSRPGADQAAILGDADRAVFALSVEKRRNILEGSLGIVLAQWAFYRFGFRAAPRPVRLVYGAGACLFTMQYATHRAKKVTNEMFGSIVNLPEDSSLGNEARIILADLEGPDGPYYTASVDEELRKRIFDRTTSETRAADADDVHPQRSLRPRLLADMGSEEPVRSRGWAPSLTDAIPKRSQQNQTVVNTGRPSQRKEPEDSELVEVLQPLPPYPEQGMFSDAAEASAEKPRDLLDIIRVAEQQSDAGNAFRDEFASGPDDTLRDESSTEERLSALPPSQRRAAERAIRRNRARMRADGRSQSG